jgi:hypothetical protein
MKNILIFAIPFLLLISCKNEGESENILVENTTNQPKVNLEHKYVVNDSFKIGDVRRYGIKIGGNDKKHPFTKKSTIESILEMASETETELFFPEGYYNFSLIIKGLSNVTIKSQNAEFSGPIYIIDDENKKKSSDITIKGHIKTYYKLFLRNSQDIEIDSITIESNPTKNSSKIAAMGCDIYSGVKYVYIKNLIIKGLGDSEKYHGLTRAALQVHGWNNNPEEVLIDNVEIESSRHGIYLTGVNNTINRIKINAFGTGKIEEVRDLEDSNKGETQMITGFWINRCNNCNINNLIINTKNSKGKYAVWLDGGAIAKQSIIEKIELVGGNKKLDVFAEEDTNVVVRELINN